MKFPSLFRTPTHKRFHFEPRYYDPIKEDIARRTARIKQEVSGDKNNNYRANISNAFTRKSRQSNKSGLIQFSLITAMFCTFFGYIYYGDIALYLVLSLLGLYLLYRFRGLFNFR
jgi:hypothetical protein